MIDVLILKTKIDRASALRRDHGNRFTFVDHMDLPGRPMAVLMACKCEGGHGAAALPLKVWLDCSEAQLDLVREAPVVLTLPLPQVDQPLAA